MLHISMGTSNFFFLRAHSMWMIIYLTNDGYLGCFHFLNCYCECYNQHHHINILIQKWHFGTIPRRYTSGSGKAETKSTGIFSINLDRYYQTAFLKGCSYLYLPKQHMRVSFSPQTHKHWVSSKSFAFVNHVVFHCHFDLYLLKLSIFSNLWTICVDFS